MSEGVAILMIKLNVLLRITVNHDSIFVLDVVTISMGIKDLVHHIELLGNFCELPFPPPLGMIEDIIIFFIGGNGEVVILIYGPHRLTCIFSSFPYHLYLPIIICTFSISSYPVKSSHIVSILISRDEYVDGVSVIY